MTNAEAIETLKANYPDACFEQLREAVDAAIDALKAQASWIPVTERLPEVFKHVLVNIPGMALLQHPACSVQEAYRDKNGMWYSNGFRYEEDEITHWMPLPEPPKGERKDDEHSD